MMLELPLVVVNVQRGGPSTGLPTKTEQADPGRPSTAAMARRRSGDRRQHTGGLFRDGL